MQAPEGYWIGGKHEFTEHDYEWLHTEYVVNGKSSGDIAEEIGAYRSTVCNWLRDAGLTRTRKERGERHSERMSDEGNPAWVGGTSAVYHLRKLKKQREQRCRWCGTTENVIMHHIDHDRANGADDNLVWLCRACHHIATGLHRIVRSGVATSEFDETKHELTIRFRR